MEAWPSPPRQRWAATAPPGALLGTAASKQRTRAVSHGSCRYCIVCLHRQRSSKGGMGDINCLRSMRYAHTVVMLLAVPLRVSSMFHCARSAGGGSKGGIRGDIYVLTLLAMLWCFVEFDQVCVLSLHCMLAARVAAARAASVATSTCWWWATPQCPSPSCWASCTTWRHAVSAAAAAAASSHCG